MAKIRAAVQVDLIDNASPNSKRITQATDRLRQAQIRAAQATQVIAAAELRAAESAVQDAAAKGQSAAATEDLAEAELRAANAAKKLAQAEIASAKATAQQGQASKQAASALGTDVPAGANAAAAGLGNAKKASRTAAFAMASQVNTVGELAFSFGNLSPATRGLGMAMVMAGGNAFAFAGSMGVAGVVLGTAVGIIPGLISLYQELSKSIGAAGVSAAEAAADFNTLIDARAEELRQRERQADIFAGEGSLIETQAALGVVRDRRDGARRRQDLGSAGISDLGNEDVQTGLLSVAADFAGAMFGGENASDAMRQAFIDQRAQATEDERQASFDFERLQGQALPRVLAREQQEEREGALSTAGEQRSAAQRELSRQLQDAGLSDSQRSAIEQDASAGNRVRLDAFVRSLPPGQRQQVLQSADRLADATGDVEYRQRVVDQAPLRALEETRQTATTRGEDLGSVTIGSGGAGGGPTRTELQLANTANPMEEAARAIARGAEAYEESGRRLTEAARRTERAAARAEQAQRRGPSALGGAD